jgi:hypothetical protein
MRSIFVLILLLLVIGCEAYPIEPTPAKPTETHAAPVQLAPNSELSFGGCKNVMWVDDVWGNVWERQCWPDGYTLYELGKIPIQSEFIGAGYSILPGGRAGRFGYTTELPIRFEPGAYKLTLTGHAHLWGNPDDYGVNILIGENSQHGKQLRANGNYEYIWFWCAGEVNLLPVTFYASFVWGSATADSYLTFDSFEIVPVSIDHCK